MEWIINEDKAALCPEDKSLVQRYTLATLYFSTNGDRWLTCNKPDNVSDAEAVAQANEECTIAPVSGSGSDAWLTPGSECSWGGVICDSNLQAEQIDIGKLSISCIYL
jgi:hypothetical protein